MKKALIRLNRYLASMGHGARRTCDRMIEAGRVRVNAFQAGLGQKIDPSRDKVELDGVLLEAIPVDKFYFKFYKPVGMLCSLKDPHHTNSLAALGDKIPGRFFPVGRLDQDSEGLLLLTNDGDLSWKMTHPAFGVEKIYHVGIDRPLLPTEKMKFTRGVKLEEGVTRPCRLWRHPADPSSYMIVLKEGKKRQLRRMMEHFGRKVHFLKRIEMGHLRLENMKSGEIRKLTPQETLWLRSIKGKGLKRSSHPKPGGA